MEHKVKAVHEFVIDAVKQNEYALKQVASDLKVDHEFRLAAVRQHGDARKHATSEPKPDGEFMREALEQIGYALEHAASELNALVTSCSESGSRERGFMLEAVKQNRRSLDKAAMKDDLAKARNLYMTCIMCLGYALA